MPRGSSEKVVASRNQLLSYQIELPSLSPSIDSVNPFNYLSFSPFSVIRSYHIRFHISHYTFTPIIG